MEFECKYCRLRWEANDNDWNEENIIKLIGIIQSIQCPTMVRGINHAVHGVIE